MQRQRTMKNCLVSFICIHDMNEKKVRHIPSANKNVCEYVMSKNVHSFRSFNGNDWIGKIQLSKRKIVEFVCLHWMGSELNRFSVELKMGLKCWTFEKVSKVLNVVHRNGWLTENRLISCCLAAFSKTSLEVPFAHFPKIWFIRFFDWWMIYSSTCSSSIHESNCTIFKESFGWFVIVIESSPSNQWKFPFFKLQFHKSKLHRRTHWTDFVMRFTQKKRTFKEYFSAAALSPTHTEWMEIGKIHFDSLAIVIIFGNS